MQHVGSSFHPLILEHFTEPGKYHHHCSQNGIHQTLHGLTKITGTEADLFPPLPQGRLCSANSYHHASK